jgi:zinc protease
MFQNLQQKKKLLLMVAFLAFFITSAPTRLTAQSGEPTREQLLNGLKILLISRPGDPHVLLKLRVHSGAAFDTAGKTGTMALLGDLLFPDPVTFEYFKDEIDGKLVVETNFDSIDLTLQGRATEYDRIVDTLRVALVTTPLTPENVTRIRDAKIKVLAERKLSAAEAADRLAEVRLLGNYPYARDPIGTAETLARIERADLMLARERFLSPNNATLVIIGGVDQRRAMRALRQLLGGWRKTEELVPATFRQPAAPDARILVANFPEVPTAEVRLATRGLARGDRDYLAATLLSFIVRERWQKLVPEGKLFARHEAHTLPGVFMMGAAVTTNTAGTSLEAARSVLKALMESPVSAVELESAKNQYLAAENKIAGNDKLANDWLNIEAFTLPAPAEQMRIWSSLSPADLQRVANRLFNVQAAATVAVGNAAELKTELAQANVEILGVSPQPAETPTTAAPAVPAKRRTFVFTPKPSPLIKNQKPTPPPD